MRKLVFAACLAMITSHLLNAQSVDTRVIRTNSEMIKLGVNGHQSEEKLPFSQEKSDTLRVPINVDPLNLELYTDIDSIITQIPIDSKLAIEIQKTGMKSLVLIFHNGIEIDNIAFDTTSKNNNLKFVYENGSDNLYLKRLKTEYPIDSIAALGKTDLEKVQNISSWVHGLWKHDGNNTPKQNDALYILEEVKNGQRFRCVEYGIVTTACLNSIGLPSRTLALKTKGVETTPTGAGHVVMEVFLKDLNKWVVVDPQWDAIACLNGVPLNAVELQKAITEKKDIKLLTSDNDVNVSQYNAWIYPYLYYFSYKFDNRENISGEERIKIDGKSDIMLVPLGAKEPSVFQIKYPIDYCIYTNSILDFYGTPY